MITLRGFSVTPRILSPQPHRRRLFVIQQKSSYNERRIHELSQYEISLTTPRIVSTRDMFRFETSDVGNRVAKLKCEVTAWERRRHPNPDRRSATEEDLKEYQSRRSGERVDDRGTTKVSKGVENGHKGILHNR